MNEPKPLPETKAFPAASGITGVIARFFGVHPLAAAAVKYGLIALLSFGGFTAWKYSIKKDVVQEIVIDEQTNVIEKQQQSAEDAEEDTTSKAVHVEDTINREIDNTEKLIKNQASRIAELEMQNDLLKKEADDKPCLREYWSNSLQRGGGFDINRSTDNKGAEAP